MAKLTEKQKKNIVALYAAGGISQKALARKYGVSESTIRNTINSDPDFAENCGHIKKEAEEEEALEEQEEEEIKVTDIKQGSEEDIELGLEEKKEERNHTLSLPIRQDSEEEKK